MVKDESPEMDTLRHLIMDRKELKEDMEKNKRQWDDLNARILKLMKTMKKRQIDMGKYGKVVKVVVKSYDWLEDEIDKWYEGKGFKSPFRKVRVFHPDLLERDINKGKVPRKMLKKWADVKIKSIYVRVDTK